MTTHAKARSGARWLVPYLAVSAVHILSLVLGADDVAHVTKLLLMPLLMVVVVGSQRRSFGTAEIAVLAALSFAWIGDVFVSDASSSSFVIGLAAFLLCHVVYFTIFVRTVRTRRIPLAALLLVGWWGGMLFLLRDDLGAFMLPLAVYGLILGASTAAAFATNATIAGGAILFLLSDTSLAWALFAPTGTWWNSDSVIMTLYVVGQLFIVTGILQARERSREPASVSG